MWQRLLITHEIKRFWKNSIRISPTFHQLSPHFYANPMQTNIRITIILDKRYASTKHGGKFPAKLRVTFREGNKWRQDYFSYNMFFTPADFKRITKSPKPEDQFTRSQLLLLEQKAWKVVNTSTSITRDLFHKLFILDEFSESVNSVFRIRINQLRQEGREGSAIIAQTALNRFNQFKPGTIYFYQVTVDWLKQFAAELLKENRSITTAGMYLREMRAVFNLAIGLQFITKEIYPFGKGKFSIREELKIKLPVGADALHKLKQYQPVNQWEKRAVDYWFFCYYSNGMNIADVLSLRREDLQGDFIVYDRNKTQHLKTEVRKIYIPIRQELQEIMLRCGSHDISPKALLFGVLNDEMSPRQKKLKTTKFNGKLNRYLRKIGRSLDIPNLTTGLARHTFANQMLNAGQTKEYIQYALGHNNITTTEHYVGSFMIDTIMKANKNL